MSQALVAATKADLEARGVIPLHPTTNEAPFQIMARVAWAKRLEGAQLIVKRPEQNGWDYQGVRYSHDSIAFPSGWIDGLANAGPPANENRPVWNGTPTDPSADLVDPFDLDADVVDPPSGSSDVDDALKQLNASIDALEAAVVRLENEWDNTDGHPADPDTAGQILDAANRVDQLTERVTDVLDS